MPPARPPKPRRAASANAASNDTGKEGIQALALRKMMGVDLTAIPTIGPGTALVIASEIGPDFSAFPSAQHFCSWLALAPGTRISGGKNLPGKSPKGGQPRRAGPAHGGHGRAPAARPFIGAKHRVPARPNGHPRCDQGDRPRTRLPDLPDGDRRARNTSSRASAPTRSGALNRKFAHLDRQAQKLGFQLVPKTRGEGKTEHNAVNLLGICYSREHALLSPHNPP